jgi:hypothetical protein
MQINLTLDLKQFAEGLKSAVKMTELSAQQMRQLLSGVQVEADTSDIDAELERVQSLMGDIPASTMIDMEGDASGAESAADQATEAVNEVPESHSTDFEGNAGDLLSTVSQLGMAYQGVSTAVGQLSGKISELNNLSNFQEKSDRRLLLVSGDYTEALQKQADEIQKLTTTGDEVAQSYMVQAQNMGFLAEESAKAARDAIGLANKYSEAGLSEEVAIKGMALAREEDYNMLKRYIPALRTATDATDAQRILNEAAADGWRLATQEVNSGYGAMEQYGNLLGDTKEVLGDMIKEAIYPFIKAMSQSIMYLNDHPQILKIVSAAVMGLAAATVALTVKQVALNAAKAVGAALTGNWIGLAAAAVVGIGAWAAGNAIFKSSQDKVNDSIKEGTEANKAHKKSIDEMISSSQQYAAGLDYDKALKELESISKEIDDLLADIGADREMDILIKPGDMDDTTWLNIMDQLNALQIKEAAVKQQLADNNKDYYNELKFDAAGYYDYALSVLEKEKQARIASGAWTEQQAEEVYQYKRNMLDEEWIKYYETKTKIEANSIRAKLIVDDELLDGLKPPEINVDVNPIVEEEKFQGIGDMIMNEIGLSDEQKQQATQSYSLMSSQVTGIFRQMYSNLQDQRMEDLTKLEERAEAEGWTAEQLAAEKDKINKKFEKEEKDLKKKEQVMQITSAIINTANAATKALGAGPILGPIMAAMITALGMYQVNLIKAQKYAAGGLVNGKEQLITVNEEGPEYVLNNRATRSLGTPLLNYINKFPDQAKNLFAGLPKLPSLDSPQFAFASGGSTANASSELKGLKEEIKEMKKSVVTAIRALNLNVVNQGVSRQPVNIVVETSDPETTIRKMEDTKKRIIQSGGDFD